MKYPKIHVMSHINIKLSLSKHMLHNLLHLRWWKFSPLQSYPPFPIFLILSLLSLSTDTCWIFIFVFFLHEVHLQRHDPLVLAFFVSFFQVCENFFNCFSTSCFKNETTSLKSFPTYLFSLPFYWSDSHTLFFFLVKFNYVVNHIILFLFSINPFIFHAARTYLFITPFLILKSWILMCLVFILFCISFPYHFPSFPTLSFLCII